MNPSLALHTAARRYCLERYRYWISRYFKIPREGKREGFRYTNRALDTFPRYNVLNAIRVKVERIDSDQLDEIEETRFKLLLAGETANDLFTQGTVEKIASRAMAEEREAFLRYIGELGPMEFSRIEPLG